MSTLDRKTNVRALAVYTAVFLAVAALVFYPFWSQGRTFIYYYAGQERDGFTQHYTAFVYIGQYIREWLAGLLHGRFELKHFDFALGYGEDVIQSLGYYGFGDPLMLLSALVPQRLASGFYQVYILLELWLAGVSFSVLGREKGYGGGWLLPCSLIYVFSGFALWAGLCHPEFLAPMIWFPLMLVGIERVLAGRRPAFLAVTTVLYALTGYYWLFMGTLFTCLYALVRVAEEQRGLRAFGWFFLRSAGGYALGLMCAAPVFVPNVMGFLQSNRTGGERGLPVLLVSGEEAWAALTALIAPGSWNFAALAAVVLPGILLVLAQREKKYRGLQVLTVLLGLFCLMPVVGWLCNAGAYQTTRWYVFLDFFAALVTLAGLNTLPGRRGKTAVICAIAVLLYAWAARNSGGVGRYALGMLVLSVLILLAYTLARSDPGRRGVCAVLTLLVAGNCAGSAHRAFEEYVPMFAQQGLVDAQVAAMPANAVPEGEVWQRVDQDYAENPNASMLLNYAGLASYFSTSNGNTAEFLSEMELPLHNKVLFPDLDSRTFLQSVLATRWFAEAGQGGRTVPYGYRPVEDGLWEDPGVLPLGFAYDTIVSEADWSGLSALERQERMLRAVYVEGVEPAGAVPESRLIPLTITQVEGQGAQLQGGEINAFEAGSSLTITFEAVPDSEVYLRLPGVMLAWADTPQFSVGVQTRQGSRDYVFSSKNFLWHSTQEAALLCLGYSREGLDQVTLTFEQPGGLRADGVEVWCQPMSEYESWREGLRRESLTDIRVDTDRITGRITTAGRRVLAFAIPYSPGWDISVDGQPAQARKANGFLLAVELGAGEHSVELRYHSPGFRAGLLLSGLGLAAVAGMLLNRKKDERRREYGQDRGADSVL